MTSNPEKVNTVLEELRRRIQDGEYGRSGRLPSRLQLAKEFDTSAETINKAVNKAEQKKAQEEGKEKSAEREGKPS